MLLDYRLLEDRPVGVGLFVADGEAFVFELADEFVGVDLFGELMEVGSGAVLVDEVGVTEGDEETGGLWHGSYLARENDRID